MTPILRQALGADFDRLHPRLRAQYGFTSKDNLAFKARGVMHEIFRGRFYVVPFLHIGALRRAVFADTGRDVSFTVENYAYLDPFGRETLTWTRRFDLPTPRYFDETLTYSEKRRGLVVYMGSHQHLAVQMRARVDEEGALIFRTGAQRLYELPVGIRFPLLLSGIADVRESFNDASARFEVDVRIANPIWGTIFGYHGHFTGDVFECPPKAVPSEALPRRSERRE